MCQAKQLPEMYLKKRANNFQVDFVAENKRLYAAKVPYLWMPYL